MRARAAVTRLAVCDHPQCPRRLLQRGGLRQAAEDNFCRRPKSTGWRERVGVASLRCWRLTAGAGEGVDRAAADAWWWLVGVTTKEVGPAEVRAGPSGCGWFRSHVGQWHRTRLHKIRRTWKRGCRGGRRRLARRRDERGRRRRCAHAAAAFEHADTHVVDPRFAKPRERESHNHRLTGRLRRHNPVEHHPSPRWRLTHALGERRPTEGIKNQ